MLVLLVFAVGTHPLSDPQLPIAPPPRVAVDPELAKHLAAWRTATKERVSVRATVTLSRTTPGFKHKEEFSGVVLWMRPNYCVMRLNNDADRSGVDYEAFICDGSSTYAYSGLARSITQWPLVPSPPQRSVGPPTQAELLRDRFFRWLARACNPNEQLPMQWLAGLDVPTDTRRFVLTLAAVRQNTIDIEITPLRPGDQDRFTKAIVRLSGPMSENPYTVLRVQIARESQTDVWTFRGHLTNIPGLQKKNFQFQPVKGFQIYKPDRANSEGGKR